MCASFPHGLSTGSLRTHPDAIPRLHNWPPPVLAFHPLGSNRGVHILVPPFRAPYGSRPLIAVLTLAGEAVHDKLRDSRSNKYDYSAHSGTYLLPQDEPSHLLLLSFTFQTKSSLSHSHLESIQRLTLSCSPASGMTSLDPNGSPIPYGVVDMV